MKSLTGVLTRILFIFISVNVFTASPAKADLCICEVMSRPEEIQWYKKGCSIWLSRQNSCSQKITRTQSFSGEMLVLPKTNDNLVRLGFVGHWSGSYQTVNFVNSVLLPFMKQTGKSVIYDNTACSGHRDSDFIFNFVQQYIKPQLKSGQFLSLKANQVLSIGLWDAVLGDSYNLYSKIDTRKTQVEYPACRLFEGNRCLERSPFSPASQLGEKGFCRENNEIFQLQCMRGYEQANGDEAQSRVVETLLWKKIALKKDLDDEKARLNLNPNLDLWMSQ